MTSATLPPLGTRSTLEELLARIDALPPAERRRLRAALCIRYDRHGEAAGELLGEPHRLRR